MNEMSLRDRIAATISTEFIDQMEIGPDIGSRIVGRNFPGWNNPKEALSWLADLRAKLRYMEADAMMKAREKCDGE